MGPPGGSGCPANDRDPGAAGPGIGDADAGGEAHFAVHHQQLSVGTMVDVMGPQEPRLVVTLHLDPSVLHLGHQQPVHGQVPTRAPVPTI